MSGPGEPAPAPARVPAARPGRVGAPGAKDPGPGLGAGPRRCSRRGPRGTGFRRLPPPASAPPSRLPHRGRQCACAGRGRGVGRGRGGALARGFPPPARHPRLPPGVCQLRGALSLPGPRLRDPSPQTPRALSRGVALPPDPWQDSRSYLGLARGQRRASFTYALKLLTFPSFLSVRRAGPRPLAPCPWGQIDFGIEFFGFEDSWCLGLLCFIKLT